VQCQRKSGLGRLDGDLTILPR
jgi:hypothetical protein